MIVGRSIENIDRIYSTLHHIGKCKWFLPRFTVLDNSLRKSNNEKDDFGVLSLT